MRLKKIILWVLAVNFATCTIVRLCQGGRFVVEARSDAVPITTEATKNRLIEIAGLQNQANKAYQYLQFPDYEEVPLRFSYFGYNPRNTAKQLQAIVQDGDAVLAISISAKTVEFSDVSQRCTTVLINPCSHPLTLKPPFRLLTKTLTWPAEVLSYGLGWISVLPIIPADMGERTSLALMFDQLFWIGHGEPTCSLENTGIILSTQDEFLDNDALRELYPGMPSREIDTRHGRTGSPKVAGLYETAIQEILTELQH